MFDNRLSAKVENFINSNSTKVSSRVAKLASVLDTAHLGATRTTFAALYEMATLADHANQVDNFKSLINPKETKMSHSDCCNDDTTIIDEIEEFAQQNENKVDDRARDIAAQLDKLGFKATRTTFAALYQLALEWRDGDGQSAPTFAKILGEVTPPVNDLDW